MKIKLPELEKTIKKILFEELINQKKIFILIGPPSIGKSSWIAGTFNELPYIISRDDIVDDVASNLGWTYDDMFATPPAEALVGEKDVKYGEVIQAPPYMPWAKTAFDKVINANKKVHALLNARFAAAVKSGQDIVVDMTNMNKSARKKALSIVNNTDKYKKIAVVFEFDGAEELIKSVAKKRAEAAKRMGKSKTIPDSVFTKMFSSFQRPTESEGFDEIISVDNRELLKKIASNVSEVLRPVGLDTFEKLIEKKNKLPGRPSYYVGDKTKKTKSNKQMAQEINKCAKEPRPESCYDEWTADKTYKKKKNESIKLADVLLSEALDEKLDELFALSSSFDLLEGISDKTRKTLRKKAKEANMPLGALTSVYEKGLSAWLTGHRQGTPQHAWAMGRVNSFISGGKTRKVDKSEWKKVQQHRKKKVNN